LAYAIWRAETKRGNADFLAMVPKVIAGMKAMMSDADIRTAEAHVRYTLALDADADAKRNRKSAPTSVCLSRSGLGMIARYLAANGLRDFAEDVMAGGPFDSR
jgi:hypothetical protein